MNETISKDQIQSNDVLCCKSSFAFGHTGNQKFRQLIQENRAPYQSAAKKHKQTFIQNIITAVRESNGRFLRPSNDNNDPKVASLLWTQLTDEQLQCKVGHALRSGKTKSSDRKSSNPSNIPCTISPPSKKSMSLLSCLEASSFLDSVAEETEEDDCLEPIPYEASDVEERNVLVPSGDLDPLFSLLDCLDMR